MNKNDELLLVRIYGERHGDHWALVSLDFGLAAQGATLDEAFKRLDGQIKDYIFDATLEKIRSLETNSLNGRHRLSFSLSITWLFSDV